MEDSETEAASTQNQPRLVIVSNRLPIVLNKNEHGVWEATRGSGGLVTAMAPVLRDRGGLWIGWPGTSDVPADEIKTALTDLGGKAGFKLEPVALTEEERLKYYQGFSNEIIWPLFHDMLPRCNFDPSYWGLLSQGQRQICHGGPGSSGVKGLYLDPRLPFNAHGPGTQGPRRQKPAGILSPHTLPSLDIFVRAPWRRQLLKALLGFDLIGFQTLRDLREFCHLRTNIDPRMRSGRRRPRGRSMLRETDRPFRRLSDQH